MKIPTLKHTRNTQKIDGNETEISTFSFADKILVVLSQTGRMGPMILASKDLSSGMDSSDPSYTIKSLSGNTFEHDPIPQLFARRLIAEIGKSTDRPLLISISLGRPRDATKKSTLSTVKQLVAHTVKCVNKNA